MTINRRTPVRITSADGATIVRVPLATGQHATVDAEDFDRLRAMGFTDQWTANRGESPQWRYVRCAHAASSGRLVTVARLIMEAPEKTWVRYHDGDHFNLRRSNLRLEKGHNSKARERDAMEAVRAA